MAPSCLCAFVSRLPAPAAAATTTAAATKEEVMDLVRVYVDAFQVCYSGPRLMPTSPLCAWGSAAVSAFLLVSAVVLPLCGGACSTPVWIKHTVHTLRLVACHKMEELRWSCDFLLWSYQA
jgi:hypothetical protein